MLNSKQRAKLLAYSNSLEDVCDIGISGPSDIVLKNIEDYLVAHELAKVKVQKGCTLEVIQVAQIIADSIKCDIVRIIGRKIILYKYSHRKGVKHYEL